jgi:FAD/FMN-containing dehydrogenase
MYGKKGFVQYQFVVPLAEKAGLIKIMRKISEKNMGSFLTVLKVFGPQDSLISFPMEGYTLAMDFPLNEGLFAFLDELDMIVKEHGGRVYLTKDARMDAQFFKESYPSFTEFVTILNKYNPQHRFTSMLSKRLMIQS